jgi:hypothetical protein
MNDVLQVVMANPAPDSVVTCKHCAAEIRFLKPAKLLPEFAALCSKCGRRKIYQATDMRPVDKKL